MNWLFQEYGVPTEWSSFDEPVEFDSLLNLCARDLWHTVAGILIGLMIAVLIIM